WCQATVFQTSVFHVSRVQRIPPSVGFFQRSGEPYSTGYSARAKPSAGRRPLFAAGRAGDWSAAFALRRPLPSALGSGRPLAVPYFWAVPTRSALIWSGERPGRSCSRRAAAPDTTPVAIEVPVSRK